MVDRSSSVGVLIRHSIDTMITGKPFEKPIRNAYSLVYGYWTHDPNLYYDKQAKRVMARVLEKNSNCLDVGANEGTFVKHVNFPSGSPLVN